MQNPIPPGQTNPAIPYGPENDRRKPREEDLFQAEIVQSEREWLHEQIRLLRQALSERSQAVVSMSRELETMNGELQQQLMALPPELNLAKEFVRAQLAQEPGSIEGYAKLLSFIYGITVEAQELTAAEGHRVDSLEPGESTESLR